MGLESAHEELWTVAPTRLRELVSKKRAELCPTATNGLKDRAGLYVFWWMGAAEELERGTTTIQLAGPHRDGKRNYLTATWKIDTRHQAGYIPLYVGKSTTLARRISQHVLLKKRTRVHEPEEGFRKAKPRTSTCQLRLGVEHVLRDSIYNDCILDQILDNVGITYQILDGDDKVADRFYGEVFLIGHLKPWFNLDAER